MERIDNRIRWMFAVFILVWMIGMIKIIFRKRRGSHMSQWIGFYIYVLSSRQQKKNNNKEKENKQIDAIRERKIKTVISHPD